MSRDLSQDDWTGTVTKAVELATAGLASGELLSTAKLVVALARTDPVGHWERVWLQAGTPGGLPPDPRSLSPDKWAGVRLTRACADALREAIQISIDHGLGSAPPGAVALAFLRTPDCGAAVLLTAGDMSRLSSASDLVSDAILGTRLQGLQQPTTRVNVGRTAGRVPFAAERAAYDIDLLLEVASSSIDQQLAVVLRRYGIDAVAVRSAHQQVSDLASYTADDVAAQARERFDVAQPTAPQLLATMAAQPSAAIDRMLSLLSIDGDVLAYECTEVDTSQSDDTDVRHNYAVWFELATLVLTVAAIGLLVVPATGGTNPWRFALIPLLLFPAAKVNPLWTLLPLLPVWIIGGPAPASAVLLAAAANHMQQINSRHVAFMRTGVWLSLKQWRSRQRAADLSRLSRSPTSK